MSSLDYLSVEGKVLGVTFINQFLGRQKRFFHTLTKKVESRVSECRRERFGGNFYQKIFWDKTFSTLAKIAKGRV